EFAVGGAGHDGHLHAGGPVGGVHNDEAAVSAVDGAGDPFDRDVHDAGELVRTVDRDADGEQLCRAGAGDVAVEGLAVADPGELRRRRLVVVLLLPVVQVEAAGRVDGVGRGRHGDHPGR